MMQMELDEEVFPRCPREWEKHNVLEPMIGWPSIVNSTVQLRSAFPAVHHLLCMVL